MIRFASLGSGSAGNALLVERGATRLLVDCGFGLRDATARLERLGVAADSLSGLLVTHEHGDHIGGVYRLARRHRLPVWLTYGTWQATEAGAAGVDVRLIDARQAFAVGDLEVRPYTVPHDAREPVQYVISDGARRLGVLTDAGEVTPHIRQVLDGCQALVLECNHDTGLLAASRYPLSLQRRIAGSHGHLNNRAAAGLLATIDTSRLQHLVAAHLSAENNRPELAVGALASVLGCGGEWIGVATQETGFDWRMIA